MHFPRVGGRARWDGLNDCYDRAWSAVGVATTAGRGELLQDAGRRGVPLLSNQIQYCWRTRTRTRSLKRPAMTSA